MGRKGFTLIELLVVIAIIAILAAILFPVFARAKAKAEQASCLANVKQLMLGVLMYTSDYDNRLPHYVLSTNVNGFAQGWSLWIEPYVKNFEMFFCPGQGARSAAHTVGGLAITTWYMGYVVNNVYWNDDTRIWREKDLNYFHHPTHFVMFAEGDGGFMGVDTVKLERRRDGDFLGTCHLTMDPPCMGSGTPYTRATIGRHNGVANMGFLDGHAKAVTIRDACANPAYYFCASPTGGQAIP